MANLLKISIAEFCTENNGQKCRQKKGKSVNFTKLPAQPKVPEVRKKGASVFI